MLSTFVVVGSDFDKMRLTSVAPLLACFSQVKFTVAEPDEQIVLHDAEVRPTKRVAIIGIYTVAPIPLGPPF